MLAARRLADRLRGAREAAAHDTAAPLLSFGSRNAPKGLAIFTRRAKRRRRAAPPVKRQVGAPRPRPRRRVVQVRVMVVAACLQTGPEDCLRAAIGPSGSRRGRTRARRSTAGVRHRVVESGEVDRIIVTNSKVVKSYSPRLRVPGEAGGEDGRVENRMPGTAAAAASERRRGTRARSVDPQAPSYHFAIGSVEIFERKFEAAQRQLGIDFAARSVRSETPTGPRRAPSSYPLLIIGAWLYVMRRRRRRWIRWRRR